MKKVLITCKSLLKKHYHVLIILVITLIFFFPIFSSSKILNNIHYINDMTFQSENIRAFIHDSKGFPLWTPYYYAGQPFIAIPEHYLFDLNFIYILAFKNIFLAMNLAVISYFFLAGFGMYLLVYGLIKKQNAALIAAVVFMFNGLMFNFILGGHLNILESYALIPFVFLFVHKALHREWAKNSVLAGIFLSLMIYAGGIIFFLYIGIIIATYVAWNLIGKNFAKKVARTALISIVIGFFLIGLSALKLLPVLEFTKMSSRGSGVSYQEFLGEPIILSNFWNLFIKVSSGVGFSGAIGISSLILLLFGFLSFRKKIIFYSIIMIVVAIMLASGTFLAVLLHQLPGFGQMRHIERALVIFVFFSPILVAYGYNNLISLAKQQNIKEAFVFLFVFAVLLVELVFLQNFPEAINVTKPLDIPTLREISKDKTDFRIATHALSTPIGASGYNYYSQLGIPAIKGGGGIWINDYVQYLAVAQQFAPSKMFGILNGKYIVSKQELGDPGLELKNKFDGCSDCPITEAYGPYLHENKNAVPRAFHVNNAVLIVGNKADVRDFTYDIIIRFLNPLSTVLIEGSSTIDKYGIEELKTFNSIILLSNSVQQKDIPLLQQYVNNNGILLPNIIEGETSIPNEKIESVLAADNSKELKVNQISFNEYSLNIRGIEGWVVLSERFAHFPGWTADIDSKIVNLNKANSVVSAVYVDPGDKLNLKYKPKSFRNGLMITLITIIILLIYLAYNLLKK